MSSATPISKEIVDRAISALGIRDFGKATIREVVAVAAQAEKESGEEYIRMEMGVPGLPPSQFGVDAQIKALQNGIARLYPNINGLDALKNEAARFIKAFVGVDINPEGCVPVCGSMQGTFASFLTASQANPQKDTILFIYNNEIDLVKEMMDEYFSMSKTYDLKSRAKFIVYKPILDLACDIITIDIDAIEKLGGIEKASEYFKNGNIMDRYAIVKGISKEEMEKLFNSMPRKAHDVFVSLFGIGEEKMNSDELYELYDLNEDELYKLIKFNFPVLQNGKETKEVFLNKSQNVETLVVLSANKIYG